MYTNFDPTSPLQQDLMFPLCRWLDEERPGLRLERGKPSPARQEPHPPRRLQARSLRQHVLRRHHCHWRLLLSQGWTPLCSSALLFRGDSVCALHDDCLCLLDVFLARPQGSASQGGSRGDHLAGHVHHPSQHTELPSSSRLHQGHRRLVRSLCLLCLQCSPRICPGQLRLQVNLGQHFNNCNYSILANSATLKFWRRFCVTFHFQIFHIKK